MARPKGTDWDAVRADSAKGLSVAELAAKYSTSPRSIWRRKAADVKAGHPWPEPPSRGGPGALPGDAASGPHRGLRAIDGGRAPEQKPHCANAASKASRRTLPPIDFDPSSVTDEILSDLLRGAAAKMLQDWNSGYIEPGMHQSHADVFLSVVNGAARAIDKSRDVAGKKSGQPSNAEPDVPVQRVTIIRRTVPVEKAAGA